MLIVDFLLVGCTFTLKSFVYLFRKIINFYSLNDGLESQLIKINA